MSIQDLWYGYKFFRSILTEREKKIYDQIYKGIMNWQNAIPLVGVSLEQGKKIINAILVDNPMFFHVDSFTFSATLISCTINPIYCMTKLQYSAYAPQLETAV